MQAQNGIQDKNNDKQMNKNQAMGFIQMEITHYPKILGANSIIEILLHKTASQLLNTERQITPHNICWTQTDNTTYQLLNTHR